MQQADLPRWLRAMTPDSLEDDLVRLARRSGRHLERGVRTVEQHRAAVLAYTDALLPVDAVVERLLRPVLGGLPADVIGDLADDIVDDLTAEALDAATALAERVLERVAAESEPVLPEVEAGPLFTARRRALRARMRRGMPVLAARRVGLAAVARGPGPSSGGPA